MHTELVDFPKTSFASPGRRDDSMLPGFERQKEKNNNENKLQTLEEQQRLRGKIKKMLRSKEREKNPGF